MITFCDVSGATAAIVAGLIVTRIGHESGRDVITDALKTLCPNDVGNPGLTQLVAEIGKSDGPTALKVRKAFAPPSQPVAPSSVAPLIVQDSAASELQRLGYTWLKLLGSGGFGRVHLVEDGSKKKCAIKQATSVEEAAHEFQIMRALNVKNVPKVRSCSGPFLVMDLVVGRDMKSMLPTPVGLACEAGAAVGRILIALHSAGVTHGDIKPANVMVDEKGQFILIDFGAAQKSTSATRVASDVYMLGSFVRRCILGIDTDDVAPWPKSVPLGVRSIVDRARSEQDRPALVDFVRALELFKLTRDSVLEELAALYGSSDWLSEEELNAKTERRLNPGPTPSYIA